MAKQLFNNPNGNRGQQVVSIPMHKLYGIIHDRLEFASKLPNIDVDAICQNACVEVEKAMGIFPNIGEVLLPAKPKRMVVSQAWTHDLSCMQQTVLFTAVRGPDGVAKYHPVKKMLRWFRRCTLLNSLTHEIMETPYKPGGGSFTGPSYGPSETPHDWHSAMNDVFAEYLKSLDELPHHFQLHFMHAAEIVGYKHPEPHTREWWRAVYYELARDMHLHPELETEMDRRLGDDEANWRASNHVATQQ